MLKESQSIADFNITNQLVTSRNVVHFVRNSSSVPNNSNVSKKLRYVGNKAKGQISKRVFQENKTRQII